VLGQVDAGDAWVERATLTIAFWADRRRAPAANV
jgi:hypothetical protein